MSQPQQQVIHEPNLHRFSLTLADDPEPAILQYEPLTSASQTIYDLTHTYVPPSMRGKGVAAQLVKYACSFARSNAIKIIPTCTYIPVYLRRHPSDLDVVKQSN